MRTETFVFHFEDDQVFKDFFTKYYPLTAENQIPGMRCLGVATGNKLDKEDELTNLIGDLYDLVEGAYDTHQNKDKILEKAEKILGI